MSIIGCNYCCKPTTLLNNPKKKTFSKSNFGASSSIKARRWKKKQGRNNCGFVGLRPRASMVDPTSESSSSSSSSSSSTFLKRMERAWLISQQPKPVACSSCDSNGHVDCKWCGGTGFFILGDNMLCQVPSRNSSCVICAGKGSACCSDCKGTGFRAKWLEQPPIPK